MVRYQGGPNAGHSIVINGQRVVLHQIPSGILRGDCSAVGGPGMVVSPTDLVGEIRSLRQAGLFRGTLYLSDRAHVILPWHRIEDAWEEEMRGKTPGGTTLRGIGPAYEDRAGRWGIRLGELARPHLLHERLERLYRVKSHINGEGRELPPIDTVAAELHAAYEELQTYIHPTEPLLWRAIEHGEHVLLEGAQGSLLDIDYGTYPYTTSSHTTVAGAFTGAGLPPRELDSILGITKAYATRVGNGPFPTELFDATGERLRERGGERGATTGRPRRCGWLDLVLLRYAARVNGFTSFAVTKVDVLGGEDEVKVGTAYQARDGTRFTDYPPSVAEDFEKIEPVYETFPSWGEFTPALKDRIRNEGWEALPRELIQYLRYVGEETGVPVSLVSYGAGRDETVEFPPSLPVSRSLTEWSSPSW